MRAGTVLPCRALQRAKPPDLFHISTMHPEQTDICEPPGEVPKGFDEATRPRCRIRSATRISIFDAPSRADNLPHPECPCHPASNSALFPGSGIRISFRENAPVRSCSASNTKITFSKLKWMINPIAGYSTGERNLPPLRVAAFSHAG